MTNHSEIRIVPASDAKARLSELLSDVERGETVGITRHGRVVARLVPEDHQRKAEIQKTMEQIVEFRKGMPTLTLEEILSGRHEGHKY